MSFSFSVPAICQMDLLYLFYLLDTRRLFKHNLFPPASPWEQYPTFTPCFFFLPLLILTLLYLFTAGCLFFYWLFYKGYEWALSRPCWPLYIEMFSHTHPVSQLVVCLCKRWRICDSKAEIATLNRPPRFDELCASFRYDWLIDWHSERLVLPLNAAEEDFSLLTSHQYESIINFKCLLVTEMHRSSLFYDWHVIIWTN